MTNTINIKMSRIILLSREATIKRTKFRRTFTLNICHKRIFPFQPFTSMFPQSVHYEEITVSTSFWFVPWPIDGSSGPDTNVINRKPSSPTSFFAATRSSYPFPARSIVSLPFFPISPSRTSSRSFLVPSAIYLRPFQPFFPTIQRVVLYFIHILNPPS